MTPVVMIIVLYGVNTLVFILLRMDMMCTGSSDSILLHMVIRWSHCYK